MRIYDKEYDEKSMMDLWESEHAEGRSFAIGQPGESPSDVCWRDSDLKEHKKLSDGSGVIAVSHGKVLVIRAVDGVPMAVDVTEG